MKLRLQFMHAILGRMKEVGRKKETGFLWVIAGVQLQKIIAVF